MRVCVALSEQALLPVEAQSSVNVPEKRLNTYRL